MSSPDAPSGGPLFLDDPAPERIGPFRLLSILGQGSMGIVFDAEDDEGRRVALKTIRPVGDRERSEQAAARFEREARILQQLDHPGIVRLIDAGRDGDALYLAMERVEGISLLAIRRQGPLGFQPLVQLGAQLADALAHLHDAGVIHRDIKPANILIRTHGQPVITDFGISGLNEATNITRQGDLLGSPGFMAPEVIEGASTTPASDQYSLGRLLFELGARGDAPRLARGRPLLEVLEAAVQVDWQRMPTEAPWPGCVAVLHRMMATRPADRYPNAEAVVTALHQLTADGLDHDTLSGHIQQLDVPSTTSWEALAVDLADPDAPATPRDNALPVPQTAPILVEGSRVTEPHPVAELDVADASGATEPSSVAERRKVAEASGVAEATVALPDGATAESLEDDDLDAHEGLRLASGRRHADVREGIPLDQLLLQKQRRPAALAAATPTSGAAPPTDIERLQRQNRRLRDELSAMRRTRRPPWLPIPMIAIILAIAAFAGGAIIGSLSRDPVETTPRIVLVPAAPVSPISTPLAAASMPANGVPSEQDRRDAYEMLRAAHEHLHRRDVDGAIRLFRLCLQFADFGPCHRDLGAVLTLVGDPAGRRHLRRYVDTTPNADDARYIRALLDGSEGPNFSPNPR